MKSSLFHRDAERTHTHEMRGSFLLLFFSRQKEKRKRVRGERLNKREKEKQERWRKRSPRGERGRKHADEDEIEFVKLW